MKIRGFEVFRQSMAQYIGHLGQIGIVSRGALAAVLGVLFSLGAYAAGVSDSVDSSTLEGSALQTDIKVRQALEGEVSQLGLVNVFIVDQAEKLDFQSVSLVVDEAAPVTYNYSYLEASALNQNAIHHVAVLSLSPGSHRIRANIIGVKQEGKAGGNRTPTRIDAHIDIREGMQEIAVRLVDTSRLGLFYSIESEVAPLVDEDRWSRSAKFWLAGGRHFAYLSDQALAGSHDVGKQPLAGESNKEAPSVQVDDQLAPYNAAVTALASGEPQLLKAFLKGEFSSEADLILRDRGSLLLAYFYLGRGQNESAAGYFSEVRRHSPYANRALIGLGWSRLNPVDVSDSGKADSPYRDSAESTYLWSDSDDFIAWARRQSPFRNAWSVVSARQSQDLISAMTPWMELVAGDPFDPAVQEAMLIVPYTLLHLGASEQAVSRYRNAGRQLHDTATELRGAIDRVHSGKMTEELRALLVRNDSGWVQWLCGVDEKDSEGYILRLLDDGDFLLAVEGLRKIVDIKKVLILRRAQLQVAFSAEKSTPLVSEIDSLLIQLDSSFERQASVAEIAAAEYLKSELKRTESYLAEAHFALARLAEKRFGNFSEVSL